MAISGNSNVSQNQSTLRLVSSNSGSNSIGISGLSNTRASLQSLIDKLDSDIQDTGSRDLFNGAVSYDSFGNYDSASILDSIELDFNAGNSRLAQKFDFNKQDELVDTQKIEESAAQLTELQKLREVLDAERDKLDIDIGHKPKNKELQAKREKVEDEINMIDQAIRDLLLGESDGEINSKLADKLIRKTELEAQKREIEQEMKQLKTSKKNRSSSNKKLFKNNTKNAIADPVSYKELKSDLKEINKELKNY